MVRIRPLICGFSHLWGWKQYLSFPRWYSWTNRKMVTSPSQSSQSKQQPCFWARLVFARHVLLLQGGRQAPHQIERLQMGLLMRCKQLEAKEWFWKENGEYWLTWCCNSSAGFSVLLRTLWDSFKNNVLGKSHFSTQIFCGCHSLHLLTLRGQDNLTLKGYPTLSFDITAESF